MFTHTKKLLLHGDVFYESILRNVPLLFLCYMVCPYFTWINGRGEEISRHAVKYQGNITYWEQKLKKYTLIPFSLLSPDMTLALS